MCTGDCWLALREISSGSSINDGLLAGRGLLCLREILCAYTQQTWQRRRQIELANLLPWASWWQNTANFFKDAVGAGASLARVATNFFPAAQLASSWGASVSSLQVGDVLQVEGCFFHDSLSFGEAAVGRRLLTWMTNVTICCAFARPRQTRRSQYGEMSNGGRKVAKRSVSALVGETLTSFGQLKEGQLPAQREAAWRRSMRILYCKSGPGEYRKLSD